MVENESKRGLGCVGWVELGRKGRAELLRWVKREMHTMREEVIAFLS